MKTTELILLGAVGVLAYMLYVKRKNNLSSKVDIVINKEEKDKKDGLCHNETVLDKLPKDPSKLSGTASVVYPAEAQTMMGNSNFGEGFFQPKESKFN